MDRKLATFRKIKEILPIEGADNICIAKIDGWQCVVKKGEYLAGKFVIYCEVDSFLPIRPEFEFLRKSCYKKMQDGTEGFRIRTIKLRNTLSQGIAFPTSLYSMFSQTHEELGDEIVGMDISDELGIVKYEPPIPAELSGVVKGIFPSFCPRSDEERIQNLPWIFEKYKGRIFYVTEKINGTSFSGFLNNGIFGVCGRNYEYEESATNTYWRVTRELKIEEKLKKLNKDIAIQGELIGEGIQGNPYKIKGHTIKFFSAYDISERKYFNSNELIILLRELELDMVPVIASEFFLENTVEWLLEYANGMSKLNSSKKREGLVFRSIIDEKVNEIPTGHLSFKVISNEYILENEK